MRGRSCQLFSPKLISKISYQHEKCSSTFVTFVTLTLSIKALSVPLVARNKMGVDSQLFFGDNFLYFIDKLFEIGGNFASLVFQRRQRRFNFTK